MRCTAREEILDEYAELLQPSIRSHTHTDNTQSESFTTCNHNILKDLRFYISHYTFQSTFFFAKEIVIENLGASVGIRNHY